MLRYRAEENVIVPKKTLPCRRKRYRAEKKTLPCRRKRYRAEKKRYRAEENVLKNELFDYDCACGGHGNNVIFPIEVSPNTNPKWPVTVAASNSSGVM